MSDPKRWQDDEGEATELERALLSARAGIVPPPEARAEVWAGLTAAGAGAGAGLAGLARPAAGKLLGMGIKGWVGIAILAGGVGAAVVAIGASRRAPDEVTSQSAGRVADSEGPRAAPSPAAASPWIEIEPASTASSGPGITLLPASPGSQSAPSTSSPTVPGQSSAPASSLGSVAVGAASSAPLVPPSSPESALLAESHALLAARNALRAGDAKAALAQLDAMKSQFGQGALEEERAALTVEALSAAGKDAEAASAADAFLHAHAASPFASRVRAAVRKSTGAPNNP